MLDVYRLSSLSRHRLTYVVGVAATNVQDLGFPLLAEVDNIVEIAVIDENAVSYAVLGIIG